MSAINLFLDAFYYRYYNSDLLFWSGQNELTDAVLVAVLSATVTVDSKNRFFKTKDEKFFLILSWTHLIKQH